MNVGRGVGAGGEAGPSRRAANTGEARKPKKKKAKEIPRPQSSGPIPAPYLAIAPSPVSSLSRNALNDLVQPTPNHLVLPSTFVRARSSPNIHDVPIPAPSPPTNRRMYAANLAAPPLIMPGGTSATPRIQEITAPPARRRGEGRRRSEEGLRAVAQANQSMASLGVLGRIMESDPVGAPEPAPAQRRRRRVIREDQRVSQPPVSTAEEGRAIGLARGASMRRLSVWDGLPDAGEAPPPFVPPAAPNPTSPIIDDHDPPPPFEARGRSPPPTWEQAVAQTPSRPISISEPIAETASVPLLTVEIPSRRSSVHSAASSATHYASAQESPASSSEDEATEEEREDRRLWNADISAGYSLAQRVERESARKRGRELKEDQAPSGEVDAALSVLASGEATPLALPQPIPAVPVPAPIPVAEESPEIPTEVSNPAPEAVPIPITPRAVSPPPAAVAPPLVIASSTTPISAAAAVEPETSEPIPALPTTTKRTKSKRKATLPAVEVQPETAVSSLQPLEIPIAEEAAEPAETIGTRKRKMSTRTRKRSTKVKAPAADPAPDPATPLAAPEPSVVDAVAPIVAQPVAEVVESLPSASSSLHVETPFSSEPLSPAQQSQADTYLALTGSPDPTLSRSPPISTPVPLSELPSPIPRSESPPVADAATTTSAPLTSVKEGNENDSSPPDSDIIIAPSIPQRKLTRGKAIRRSSSGLSIVSDATVRSPTLSGPESPRRPLFGETQFDWRPAEREGDDAARPRPVHRKSASSVAILRSPPQTSQNEAFRHSGRALGSFDTAMSTLASPVSPVSPVSETLPPHREAALKRRELITRSPDIPTAPEPPKPIPPPLIDIFSTTPARPAPYRSPPPQISRELYQLFDEDEPVAESSAQAAARMEQEQIFKAIKRDRREWAVDEIPAEEAEEERAPTPPAKPRRPPPPPPPLRRNLISTTVGANLTPRRSIIRSADTPVTPRPIRQLSVSSQDRPPVLPTRRPAPPPPSTVDLTDDAPAEAPPLPPRPAPLYRPLAERRESSFSQADTASSLSDRTIPLTSSAASPRRPKGPRPPPPPPRWARIIVPLHDVKAPLRPSSERTQSDSASLALAVDTRNPTRRSTSEQDLRSSSGGSPLEYTDLDVLVSRLEGSGREYEGFSQITAFLGPGKSLSAKPEALATLLPGVISVDSRRVTGQGKVKLKLSLLGVRVTKCPICLGQFKKDEQAVLLPECGHVSHEECAKRWFREDWRCFVCRVPLLLEEGRVGESGGRMEEGVV